MCRENCVQKKFLVYFSVCFAFSYIVLEAIRLMRVPNRFFGIRDLAYFTAGIRDFWGKGERDSGL